MLPTATMLDAKVPRYTSYPTAPHFHSGLGAGDCEAMVIRIARRKTRVALSAHPVL